MPRRIRDLVGTLAALLVLFALLATMNPHVRDRAGEFVGDTGLEWSAPFRVVSDIVVSVGAVVSSYAADNAYLFSFSVVAVLLLILMLRA